ncbi:MAG: hypothetical protein P1S60_10610 [Anaerolineae bacterium]|nr:hypothetical protein [Anaerolineae bacterium]
MDKILLNQLQDIRHLSQQDKMSAARQKLIDLLRGQPSLVSGWLLLAQLLENPEEKILCYRRILEIDSGNYPAQQALATTAKREIISPSRQFEVPNLFEDEFNLDPVPDEDQFSQVNEIDDWPEMEQTSRMPEDDTLSAYIIQELGKHGGEDDIIREISLWGQMDWYEAKAYFTNVKTAYALTIAKKRTPLQLLIAVPTCVAGLIWLVFTAAFILENCDNSLDFLAVLVQVSRHLIGSVAMILGGTLGIYRVLKSLEKI